MAGLLFFLAILVVILLLLVRLTRFGWRVLANPEESRRFWQEHKRLLVGLAAALLVLLIAGFIAMSWLVRREVASGHFAFDYLNGKYGMHGHFEMGYSSSDQTNGMAVYSYSYGTNAGILTVAKQTNGYGDTFYVVVSDVPRK